jgi:hypothetical protein
VCVKVWDYEKQAAILSYDTPEHVADMKWNSDGSLLGMTTKDKKIRIYDPRAAEGIVEADGFAGTKAAKFEWMDNIGKIACVGFNRSSMRQYAVYDPRNMSAPLDVTDIDQVRLCECECDFTSSLSSRMFVRSFVRSLVVFISFAHTSLTRSLTHLILFVSIPSRPV